MRMVCFSRHHITRFCIALMAVLYLFGVSAVPAHACSLGSSHGVKTKVPCHEMQEASVKEEKPCCTISHCVKCVTGFMLDMHLPSLFLPLLNMNIRLPRPEVASTLILDTPERPPKIV
jgi:hypothetical protein